ncbi:Crp/Fnr family transcriptional regulator [Listeria sp. FSL L7-1582]|uniref:Crp/Fnr family transcriptional regulator n=1 Tax=Listeria portnoyi TaxID=2713504 RepID=UPI00164E4814|nr:Crp/Fnr family transcriptional regulator [Listeria portnoyi]MBC6309723.1 Crp/Fnr family transcriptional regulator [Listeria portnoyi]
MAPFIESELIEWLENDYGETRKTFPANTIFPFVEEKIILVLGGILHLENDSGSEQRILTYLKGFYLLDLDALFEGTPREITLISDTEVEIIEIDRDIFLRYALKKPSYMELVLVSHARVLSKIYTESSKIYKKTSLKVKNALQNLYNDDILMMSDKESGWYGIPDFMTKKGLASYAQVSRKTLSMEIRKLEQNNSLKFIDNQMFINPQFLWQT